MSSAVAIDQLRRIAPAIGVLVIALLAGAALLRHVGIGSSDDLRAAMARYERIAADLPRLQAAVRNRPAAPVETASETPSIAAAQWQSRLGRMAAAYGLQLASAEPLLADGAGKERAVIALELTGSNTALLGFLHEIELGAAMTVRRLELIPIMQSEMPQSDPALRIRLQAQARTVTP